MLAAVESWVKRDHAAEWKQWVARCDYIADRVSKIPGVSAVVQREPGVSLSNRSPRVTVRWDSKQLASRVGSLGSARKRGAAIALGGRRRTRRRAGRSGDTGISIKYAMMSPATRRALPAIIEVRPPGKRCSRPAPIDDPVANCPAGGTSTSSTRTQHHSHPASSKTGNRSRYPPGEFLTRLLGPPTACPVAGEQRQRNATAL